MSLSISPADYTDAEKELVEKAKEGNSWYRGPGKPELDDPANGANWSAERTIRAEVIYALAVGDNAHVHAKGVQIQGAKVVGSLDLEGAKIPHPLALVGCLVAEALTLRDADALSVNLDGSRVAGIEADGLRTRGSVFLRNGFHAIGEVRLVGAKIGGQLACSGGTFENAKRTALYADGATVDGGVFLGTVPQAEGGLRFHATGEVRLPGAKIGGQLNCSGGTFEIAEGDALSADSATVDGDVLLSERFRATGEVRLLGAKISGALNCSGGTFENAKGIALAADQATVGGNVFLGNGFHATGEVRFAGAKIGGHLDCSGGTFENAGGEALNLQRANVTQGLLMRKLSSPPTGYVYLGYAQVGELIDDEESWPENGKLILDGLVYGRLAGDAPWRARERLSWLGLQPKFWPQPYEQLARVLKEMGHEREARDVAIEKQEQLRKHGGLGFWSRARNRILGFTIAHGYKGERAFGLLILVWLLGTGMFCLAERTGVMVPSEKEAYVSYQAPPSFDTSVYALEAILPGVDLQFASKSLPEGYPIFHAPLYAIDTLLPGIDLHQKSKWYLRERTPDDACYKRLVGGAVAYFVVGWLLTLLGVGAVSGLVRPK